MYILIILTVAVLDGIWLTLNSHMYQRMYSNVQKAPFIVDWKAAIFAYLAIFIMIAFYAVPGVENAGGSFFDAIRVAGLLGLLTYAVYNFTNLAVLRDYSWKVAILDTLWGGVLFTLTSFIVVKLKKYIQI
uniref:DUF2177 family protein n=1 Tax=viral metagenome TaxID=1070528 RepID=A0A6C0BEZ1_9ZZZZ